MHASPAVAAIGTISAVIGKISVVHRRFLRQCLTLRIIIRLQAAMRRHHSRRFLSYPLDSAKKDSAAVGSAICVDRLQNERNTS
jgi:hypothetical protein